MRPRLALAWSRQRQAFGRDRDTYVHEGPVATTPSHDVAHLLLAGGSDLPWRPQGARQDVCFAEHNAVLLEHLLLRAVQLEAPGAAVAASLAFASWFCRVHYAPFPVAPDEALARFRAGLDAEAALRLFPVFWTVRALELARGAQDLTLRVAFGADARPPVPLAAVRAAACARSILRLALGAAV